jgi:hypothetical protein
VFTSSLNLLISGIAKASQQRISKAVHVEITAFRTHMLLRWLFGEFVAHLAECQSIGPQLEPRRVSKVFKSEDKQGHAKGCHLYIGLKGNPEIARDGPIGQEASYG